MISSAGPWKLPGPWKTHPQTPNRVSHRPLDGAYGSAHSYHRLYDDEVIDLRR